MADQHFIKNDAQTEDVAAAIDTMSLATRLLRRHVGRCTGISEAVAAVPFLEGQPETDHERVGAGVDQYVARLDVAVNEAHAMGIMQGLGNGGDEFRRLVGRGAVVLDFLGQGAALNEFRDNETREFGRAANVVYPHDVGVIEIGDGAGFDQISLGVFGGGHPMPVRHFDRHGAAQLVVISQINEAEAAFAQQPFDPVATNPLWVWAGVAMGKCCVLLDGRLGRKGIVHVTLFRWSYACKDFPNSHCTRP